MAELSEAARQRLSRFLWSLPFAIAGIVWMCLVDWRIAVGVFLFAWGMNIAKGE